MRTIFHIDVNSAYLSWEATRRRRKAREQGDRILLHLADNVTARIRRDGVKTRCISVTLRGNDMKKHSHQRMLDAPTDGTSRTYEVAKGLFRQLWDGHTNLRLIGLGVTQLDNEDQYQLSLFGNEVDEREHNADKAVDALREKFGDDIIKRELLFSCFDGYRQCPRLVLVADDHDGSLTENRTPPKLGASPLKQSVEFIYSLCSFRL